MAGLYLHIPFCKQACHYCNFHFSTSLKYKKEMLAAISQELISRKDYLKEEKLESIYFGGGTPSLLSTIEINAIFEVIKKHFSLDDTLEITLEANPDDLSKSYLASLSDTPINRLSIGIQSFSNDDLAYMNRAHSASEAHTCIGNALDCGFKELSIDLIYGTPTMSTRTWLENLANAFAYPITHISCYCLTVEPRTALAHQVKIGQSPPVDDEKARQQFEILIEEASKSGFEHYEISNFAKANKYARHNTAYWQGTPYLGVGPAAHSFDGKSRRWNVANNAKYIKGVFQNDTYHESEHLTLEQQYNEAVMTALRTKWGLDKKRLANFGSQLEQYFLKQVAPYKESKLVLENDDSFYLSQKGKHYSDGIAAELFFV